MYIQLLLHRDVCALIHLQPNSQGRVDVLEDWLHDHCGQNLQHFIYDDMGPVGGLFPYLKIHLIIVGILHFEDNLRTRTRTRTTNKNKNNIASMIIVYLQLFEVVTPQQLCKFKESRIIGVVCLLSLGEVIEAFKPPNDGLML